MSSKKFFKQTLSLVFLVVGVSSCICAQNQEMQKIDQQLNDEDLALAQKLSRHSWKMVSATMVRNGVRRDIYQYRPDCQRDDLFIFRDNGEYEISENELICGPDKSQASTSIWTIKNRILIVGNNDVGETQFEVHFKEKMDMAHTEQFTNSAGITFIWEYKAE